MNSKNFLEEKFIQLNKLKSMLITYPKEYKNNLVETMDKICKQIEEYLRKNKNK